MPLLNRIKQFALEAEGTEGTAETLSAADVHFEVEELEGTYTNEFNERNPLRASLSQVSHRPGIGVGQISGKAELVGGGATTTEPATNKLWLASAHGKYTVNSIVLTGAPTGTFKHGEKITSSTKVGRFIWLSGTTMYYATISGAAFAAADTITGSKSAATATVHGTPVLTARGFAYKPIDPDSASAFTANANNDGLRYRVFGSRANGSIDIEGAGKLPYFNFNMDGKAVKPIDEAIFTGVTLPTVLPESFLSAGLKVGGDLLCVDGLGLDLGLTIARRPCANDASGIHSFRITGRKPMLTISPEKELEATKDFFTEYDDGTQFDFFAQVGSTATRRMFLVAPNAQWASLPNGSREDISTYESASLRLCGSEDDGDDEYMVCFF